MLVPGVASAGDFDFGVEAFGGAFRQGNAIAIQPTDSATRGSTPTGTIPPFGPTGHAGVGVDLAWGGRGPFVFDIVAVKFAGAFGPTSRTLGAVDGTIVSADPGSMIYAGLSTGAGVRFKRRRFAFGVMAHIGASMMSTKAFAQDLNGPRELSSTPSFDLLVDLDASVCRRIDPTSRLCLAIRPHVYNFGFLNGASIALRWEVGP